MKIAIASDHGGFDTKSAVIEAVKSKGHEALDLGCTSTDSCDYPDYAKKVNASIMSGDADEGILICTTGIGMSIAANRNPGIRAALCVDPDMASTARLHNDANVLVLASSTLDADSLKGILEAWLSEKFSGVDRHARRVRKIEGSGGQLQEINAVAGVDAEIYQALTEEIVRQEKTVNLIASENYVSPAVRQAQGCSMTNKYAEGYPGKRYYNGCQCVDVAESLAIERAKELFGADHANVQPHCGSSANMAVYFSVLDPGDRVLAMSLAHGGHLTHGHPVNFSGKLYDFVGYGVSKDTEVIDYDEVEKIALEAKPKMIVAGGSAYPRALDFERFRQIADKVGAMLMVDMAHIAGLVAAKVHQDPVPLADFVTTTTHKTLRGPRSGLVLCKEQYAKAVDKSVFPGLQGGPLMHTIASKAVCFHEALQPAFRDYSSQVVKNAVVLAKVINDAGLRIVSGGTDNHLMLVDMTSVENTGKVAAAALDRAGIIVNKNAIPFDTQSPFVTSGVRIGTPAVTTRGMMEPDMEELGALIARVLNNLGDEKIEAEVLVEIENLAARNPVP